MAVFGGTVGIFGLTGVDADDRKYFGIPKKKKIEPLKNRVQEPKPAPEAKKEPKKSSIKDRKSVEVQNYVAKQLEESKKGQKKDARQKEDQDRMSKTMSENFIKARSTRIKEQLEKLYEKDREKITKSIKKIENQRLFKNELEKMEVALSLKYERLQRTG